MQFFNDVTFVAKGCLHHQADLSNQISHGLYHLIVHHIVLLDRESIDKPPRNFLGTTEELAFGPSGGESFLGPLRNKFPCEQPEKGTHHLGLHVLLPLEADASLMAMKRAFCLTSSSTSSITWPRSLRA